MDAKREKEEIIEMFGVHFETHYNLPPLASRILGTLILDSCKAGITFEELLERTGASKSSVSTSLNLLLKMGKIVYYTVPCDRKKYFKPSPLSERFSNYIKMIDFEKKIVERVIAFRKLTAECSAELCNLKTSTAYKEHILEVEELMERTIEKFKAIEADIDNNNNNHNKHNN
jgi:DNA-binding transcriptional regulator GbsR (MarR family)